VLVKVQAVSLNRSDWEALRGKPLYARLMGPLRPRHHILGSDIAGRVEAAGPTAASTCRLPSDQNAIARRSRWSPSNSAAVMSSAA
jgi:NADPH:quinone reductase-like Zn-dependent oxidoreductase